MRAFLFWAAIIFVPVLVFSGPTLFGYGNSRCLPTDGSSSSCEQGDESTTGGCANQGKGNCKNSMYCQAISPANRGTFCEPSAGHSCYGSGSTTPCGEMYQHDCYWVDKSGTTPAHCWENTNEHHVDQDKSCSVVQCDPSDPRNSN